MSKISIIGPGAIGATVAALLAQNPAHAVSVCARTPIDHLRIDSPTGTLTAHPVIYLDPATAEPADWVLIATKAYDVAGAATWLRRLRGPNTRVAVLQNGVEHVARFAPYVPREFIVPVIVDIPAERQGPGHIHQHRDGTLLVPESPDGDAFVSLFTLPGLAVSAVADFPTHAWRKLTVNAVGAVSALVDKPARIAARAPIAEIMTAIAREAITVGRAEGANLADSFAEEIVNGYRTTTSNFINSLHADRLAGRPLETDARNGAVIRIGRQHGIPTPINQMIVALLEAAADKNHQG